MSALVAQGPKMATETDRLTPSAELEASVGEQHRGDDGSRDGQLPTGGKQKGKGTSPAGSPSKTLFQKVSSPTHQIVVLPLEWPRHLLVQS